MRTARGNFVLVDSLTPLFAGVFRKSVRFITAESMPYYAVRAGRNPGIYSTWSECEEEVNRYSRARYKKFSTEQEAREFINGEDEYSFPEPRNSFRRNGGAGFQGYRGDWESAEERCECSGVVDLEDYHDYAAPRRFKSSSASGGRGNTGIVYTDGCCYRNGRHGATAGIGVYWGPGNHMNVSERLTGRPTNNRAEIQAAHKAVQQAKAMGYQNIELHTDSQFLINGITKWIHGWKRNGWRLASGDPVINREDFQALDRDLRGIHVDWVHVRGHQNDPGNEAADRLANEGANKPLPYY